MSKFQYYYKDNNCTAIRSTDDNCICWYDEQTGPFKDAPHDDPATAFAWREKEIETITKEDVGEFPF